MDFNCKHLHFIGIGGVSMMALAKMVELEGAKVSGSDRANGGHRAYNIHKGIDMVVINGAISDDNVELRKARRMGISVIDRSELLAEIEGRYTNRIAVAGTHGKSTTVAMIGAVLAAGGLNPTLHNGAYPNLVIGGKDFFVTEACEFKRSFHKLSPTVAVITNVELDHVDCYADIAEVRAAFDIFARKAGTVITHDDDDVFVPLCVAGRHNALNAALAVKVGLHFGVPMAVITRALADFRGISRRFETVGSLDIISDYAHHPTEIETTIATADEKYGRGNYLIVFQPHTYTRTRALFSDFVRVLSGVDCVLYRTFSAREKPIAGGTAEDLATAVGVPCFRTGAGVRRYVAGKIGKYSAVILTGAGDVNNILG